METPYYAGTTVCSNGLGHITKMATMPIYGKTLDKEITISSIYIPPSFSLKTEHLDSLLKHLPSPYLLLGDFNGHNILRGNKKNNSRGELIEKGVLHLCPRMDIL